MEWTSLLSTEKLAVEPEEPAVFRVYPINAFEKDYRKIVSSAAFRRLQDKTQVFPLDKCDVTRSVSKTTEIERRGGNRWDKPKKAEKSRDCGGGKF